MISKAEFIIRHFADNHIKLFQLLILKVDQEEQSIY